MKSKIRMKTSEAFRKVGLLVCFAWAGSLPQANAVDAKRPNIINILVDDMGYSDLGCYGGEIKTPNIDSLAKGGCVFLHTGLIQSVSPHETVFYQALNRIRSIFRKML